MQNKNIFKIIFRYGVPNVVSMWIFTLYTMIDGIFISRFVGPAAFAGVNLILPLINLMFSISIMIGVGSSTLISINFGKNNYIKGNKIFTFSVILNILFSLSLIILILSNIDKVLNILGTNAEIYSYTYDYLNIIILFSIFYMLGYAIEIAIKVDGNPIFPAFSVLIGGITNLILDYIFIVIFNLGVKGAAMATGISQAITCSILISYILFKSKYVKFINIFKNTYKKSISYTSLSKNFIKVSFNIIKTGLPEFVTEISTGILLLFYNIAILKNSEIFGLSIFGVIGHINAFTIMTMIGFCQGIQPIISYNLGAKNYQNLKDIFKISLIFLIALGILFYIAIQIFSENIASIFFYEINRILATKNILNIYSLFYLVMGVNIFISAYFTAIKKTFYSIIITLIRGIILNKFFIFLLEKNYIDIEIWIIPFISEIITIFISYYFVYILSDKLKNKQR